MRPISRRTVLGRLGATAGVLAGLGAGPVRAGHTPDEPRLEFHRQTRRLDAETPSVLVARADLPDGGFVMVHDKPPSGDHHASAGRVDVGAGFTDDEHVRARSDNGGTGDDHTGHTHRHDIFGITVYLPPGHYGGVKVPLTTVPAPGTYELVAMLHRDNGNETFDGPGTDEHDTVDGSTLHVNADVRFIAPRR